MDRPLIIQEIYKFYPKDLPGMLEAFDRSSETKHLRSTIEQRQSDPVWDNLLQDIMAATTLQTNIESIVPFIPCCSYFIMGKIENGYRVDIRILISLISPYWTMYTVKSRQFKEPELLTAFEGHLEEIQAVTDSMDRHELIARLMKEKLGDNYDHKELKWEDYHQEVQHELQAIPFLLTKYGFVKFPSENLFEIVPDVATANRPTLNSATFLDCLFRSLNQLV